MWQICLGCGGVDEFGASAISYPPSTLTMADLTIDTYIYPLPTKRIPMFTPGGTDVMRNPLNFIPTCHTLKLYNRNSMDLFHKNKPACKCTLKVLFVNVL